MWVRFFARHVSTAAATGVRFTSTTIEPFSSSLGAAHASTEYGSLAGRPPRPGLSVDSPRTLAWLPSNASLPNCLIRRMLNFLASRVAASSISPDSSNERSDAALPRCAPAIELALRPAHPSSSPITSRIVLGAAARRVQRAPLGHTNTEKNCHDRWARCRRPESPTPPNRGPRPEREERHRVSPQHVCRSRVARGSVLSRKHSPSGSTGEVARNRQRNFRKS